jgi:hypothetical protein
MDITHTPYDKFWLKERIFILQKEMARMVFWRKKLVLFFFSCVCWGFWLHGFHPDFHLDFGMFSTILERNENQWIPALFGSLQTHFEKIRRTLTGTPEIIYLKRSNQQF